MKFFILTIFQVFLTVHTAEASVCYGTTSYGKLEAGVKLPMSGDNFTPYSLELWELGRTYVHRSVRDMLLEAYKNLYIKMPSKKFVYAETGFKNGGVFKPHKTHQNGLSVDLMVPTVLIESGASVPFPTNISNKFGYDVEFDKKGFYQKYQIDFEALGALIVEIYKAAKNQDLDLWRVIFAPDLQHLLYETTHGEFIKKNISISKRRSWVRHDEHIHVDFEVPCRAHLK